MLQHEASLVRWAMCSRLPTCRLRNQGAGWRDVRPKVLSALMGGLLTVESVCRKYDLTEEELLSWMRAYSRRGLPGLKAKAPRQKP